MQDESSEASGGRRLVSPLIRRIKFLAGRITSRLIFRPMPTRAIPETLSPQSKEPSLNNDPNLECPKPSADQLEYAKRYLREVTQDARVFFYAVETEQFHDALNILISSMTPEERNAISQSARMANRQFDQARLQGALFWEAVARYDAETVRQLLRE